MYWQSLSDENTGNTPTDNNANWRGVRVYDTYSASNPYTINATDPRKSDYTFELVNGVPIVFRCIRDNTGKTPSQNPGFGFEQMFAGNYYLPVSLDIKLQM